MQPSVDLHSCCLVDQDWQNLFPAEVGLSKDVPHKCWVSDRASDVIRVDDNPGLLIL